jgi:acyl-CoA reductase-like NAD-dependent aldehyde dehydrogenase
MISSERRKLLIGGSRPDAASGETYRSVNPSTGEVIAALAAADREMGSAGLDEYLDVKSVWIDTD